MKTIVISLRRAHARRQSVREQFFAANVPFSFFDAFDGNDICLQEHFSQLDQDTFRLNSYRSPLPGEVGCYASHLATWKLAVQLDEPVVVLEDDCKLESSFRSSVRVSSTLVESLGYIRLEEFRRSTNKLRLGRTHDRILTVGEFDVHYLRDVPLCLLGYAISPGAAEKLVLASETLTSPVDKFVQRTWEHDVPIYAVSPSPVTRCIEARCSTIGDRSGKQKDPITMIRRALYKSTGELRKAAFNRSQLQRFRRPGSGLKIDIDHLARLPA